MKKSKVRRSPKQGKTILRSVRRKKPKDWREMSDEEIIDLLETFSPLFR